MVTLPEEVVDLGRSRLPRIEGRILGAAELKELTDEFLERYTSLSVFVEEQLSYGFKCLREDLRTKTANGGRKFVIHVYEYDDEHCENLLDRHLGFDHTNDIGGVNSFVRKAACSEGELCEWESPNVPLHDITRVYLPPR